jgi:NAD(P)H-hydrate epimerase
MRNNMKIISKADVRKLFSKRPLWSHKGDFGKLLVVGGSLRYSGSPAFVALAAIRTGTDLTLVAAPRRAADIVARFQPDLITEPMDSEYLCPSEVKHIMELAEWADALVIGGGLDRKERTYKTIRMILKKLKKPCVIDAEALRAISRHPEILKRNYVLTPHENEFQELGGERPSREINERMQQVKKLAFKLKTTILLKGHIDVISDGRQIAINKTGNPHMTKGGTGDTLAGICGGLIARGVKGFDAACAAAWINGAAGDLALRKIGPGFFVSEMLDFIPRVIWG